MRSSSCHSFFGLRNGCQLSERSDDYLNVVDQIFSAEEEAFYMYILPATYSDVAGYSTLVGFQWKS
jgi:hypothetical protein